MVMFMIFVSFILLHLAGQYGIHKVHSYENRYGLMALIGVAGAITTGIVGLFVAIGLWALLVIAAVYMWMKCFG